MPPQGSVPVYPSSTSIISRIVRLALDIFDGVCSGQEFHPARDFQSIVHNAASLVLAPVDSTSGQELDPSAMQSLFDIMNDTGLEWPGNIFEDIDTEWH